MASCSQKKKEKEKKEEEEGTTSSEIMSGQLTSIPNPIVIPRGRVMWPWLKTSFRGVAR